MRTACLGFILSTILIACVASPSTLPEPEKHSDSLLIGAFKIKFPEGYRIDTFRLAEGTSFSEEVRLYFRNITRDEYICVEVGESGFYNLLSNGRDDFLLTGFAYTRKRSIGGRSTYGKLVTAIWGEINIPIHNIPGSVVYLGHISFVFFNPQKGRKVQKLEADYDGRAVWRYIHNSEEQKLCWWMACRMVENSFEIADTYNGEVRVFISARSDYGRLYIEPFFKMPWPSGTPH